MSILYEVNYAIDADTVPALSEWLVPHVTELLTLPGFLAGTILTPDVDAAAEGNRPSLTPCAFADPRYPRGPMLCVVCDGDGMAPGGCQRRWPVACHGR